MSQLKGFSLKNIKEEEGIPGVTWVVLEGIGG